MTQPAMSGRWAASRRVRAHVILRVPPLSVTDLSCILAPADQVMQSPGSISFVNHNLVLPPL